MATINCRKCSTAYESVETIDDLSGVKTVTPCPSCGTVAIAAIEKQYGNQKITALILVVLLVFWGIYEFASSPLTPEIVSENAESNVTTESSTVEDASVISGLAPVDVYLNLEQQGFTTKKELSPCCMWVSSMSQNNTVFFSAEIYADNANSVKRVNANVVTTIDKNTISIARPFLGYVASVQYNGSQPNDARAWVEANVGKNAAKVFGGATFELSVGNKNSAMLSIYPN